VVAQPMMMVENLSISTKCSENFLLLVLTNCSNVKHLYIGMDNGLGDTTLLEIFKTNSLSQLETISIAKCGEKMTMVGVNILIDQCNKLRLIKDLRYFTGIHENEVKILQLRIREENLDLSLNEKKNVVRDPSESTFIRGLLEAQVGAIKDYFEPSTNCNTKYRLQ
jgi:hypothetical protein